MRSHDKDTGVGLVLRENYSLGWRDFFPDPMRVQVRRANGGFLPPNILDRMKRLPNRICAGGEIA